MSKKISIVTSAADGCGQPSSIRPMDHLPSRDHKGAEYKESFMLSNRSSILRGCSITTAVIAAVACFGLAGTASASTVTTIYAESFGGAATTATLAGTAPTVDNGASSTWTQTYSSGYNYTGTGQPAGGAGFQPFWNANGTITGSFDVNGNGALEVAGLNLTPVSGHIYTLTANLTPTSYIPGNNSQDGFVSLGFISGSQTAGVPPFFAGVGPWMLSEFSGSQTSPTNTIQGFFGPGTANGYTVSPAPTTMGDTSEVVLNTMQSQWVGTEYYNGVQVGAWGYASGANPTGITQVAIGVNGESATVTNFVLTDQSVPEPATLGLVAIGGLGLLLLKRRKAV
ncbi:MAG: PEP-CTERM sorting domain-containing protein [Planctomycetia bacterium]|nr:PEP-CTERM sorting domain-containing protein [Planctomycetia bacterium]